MSEFVEGSRFTVRLVERLIEGDDAYEHTTVDEITQESPKAMERLRGRINRANARNEVVRQGREDGSETSPLIRCRFCLEPLFVRSTSQQEYYFCHYRLQEDKADNCPQRSDTSIPLAIVRALQHQGLQESRLHYKLKHQIAEILAQDPLVAPGSVKVEQRLAKAPRIWRKPDVQAVVNNVRVAFEVQVSRELAPAIAAREYFYEAHAGTAILWVLPSFDPDRLNQSVKDIQVSNADHLYVLSPACIEHSLKEGRLYLECWLHAPYRNGFQLEYKWESRTVSLDEIRFVEGHGRVQDLARLEESIQMEIDDLRKKVLDSTTRPLLTDGEITGLQAEMAEFHSEWVEFVHQVAQLPVETIWPYYFNQYQNGPQSLCLVGIWLKARGIDWHLVDIPVFVQRALRSAHDDVSGWPTQSWSWIANEISKPNASYWIAPFHQLARRSGRLQELIQGDRHGVFREALERAKKYGRMPDKEKMLLKMICPALEMDIPMPQTLPCIGLHEGVAGYPIFKTPLGRYTGLVAPEWGVAEHCPTFKKRSKVMTSIRHSIERQDRLPMPSLPLYQGDLEEVVSPGADHEQRQMLNTWKKQKDFMERTLAGVVRLGS
ncbi:DUF6035 family protein [Marinobacterium weihaiense]|uniref:DUF6035 domain-containing protein n=1 Tax=Marinobacterium weihaiense TaxID=2851016 RepID=A0ABS6MGH8_9GAMM|nr:DUF6035 family protein [Marinobacterium weihaiense]MBV0934916.1 hypothetical protein [Marinobacterium weihaiense]